MDRFVVGTGRCGSTLLSRMLGECPEVCSLFEFFNGLDFGRRFDAAPVAGPDLESLLAAEQPVVNEMLRRGYRVPEITYPFADDGGAGRFRRSDPLPWLLVSLLPRLTDDPDPLFEAMRLWARARPEAPLASHYRALFAWLAGRSGRSIWIERSGSSLEYLEHLARLFPRARFLHLHRDGPETALSMREHHAYRLAVTMLHPPEERGEAAPEGEGDPLDRILESRPPVALFGRYWSEQVTRGARGLKTIAPERYRELRFEDLVARPAESLRAVADFLALPGSGGAPWIERAAGLVRGAPPERKATLSEHEVRQLESVCRPGMQVLGREP